MTGDARTPTLGRRLLCLIYDALLLVALILFAGGVAAAISQLLSPDHIRLITQATILTICPGYFAWQWIHGGQTLPMKTWRIRLESTDGGAITPTQALFRSALAVIGYLLIGISVFWTLVDRDRQFLHDRLSGTRLSRID